jgi:hypothetical protein
MSSIRWPFWALTLDVIGTLLLALGLYGLFGGDALLFSQTVSLKAFSIPLIIFGFLVMAPLVLTTVSQVRSSR